MVQVKKIARPGLLAAGAALVLFCALNVAAKQTGLYAAAAPLTPERLLIAKPIAHVPERAPDQGALAAYAAPADQPAVQADAAFTPALILSLPCQHCGVIESVRAVETAVQNSGMDGTNDMIGGALNPARFMAVVETNTSYEIMVRLDNGFYHLLHEATFPSWRNGDQVKVVNGAIRSS